MLFNIVILIVLIAIVVTCDFTPYTLTDEEAALLYSNEKQFSEEDSGIFGTSTVTGEISEGDLSNKSVNQQAEDLLNRIYNG